MWITGVIGEFFASLLMCVRLVKFHLILLWWGVWRPYETFEAWSDHGYCLFSWSFVWLCVVFHFLHQPCFCCVALRALKHNSVCFYESVGADCQVNDMSWEAGTLLVPDQRQHTTWAVTVIQHGGRSGGLLCYVSWNTGPSCRVLL